MPRDNTTLKAQLSTANAPSRTIASGGSAQVVTVILNYAAGTSYKPLDLVNGLEALYGANKVTSNRDAQPPYGTLDITINP
jgi:hypothetical protein